MHKKGIEVNLSSNLNYFDEAMAEELIRCNCDVLRVSLDGASQESCSKYQIGINFDKVKRNMRTVTEKRKGKLPLIIWEFLVTKYNEDEIPKAKEMAKEVADKLEILPLRCDMGGELFMTNREQFDSVKEWLPKDESYSMYDYQRKARKPHLGPPCHFLYSQSVINWNGSISPCCLVYFEKYDFGNIFESSFKKIWNNEKYRASRRLIFKGKESGLETICSICKRNGVIGT